MSVAYVKLAKPGQTAGFFYDMRFCRASFEWILVAVKG